MMPMTIAPTPGARRHIRPRVETPLRRYAKPPHPPPGSRRRMRRRSVRLLVGHARLVGRGAYAILVGLAERGLDQVAAELTVQLIEDLVLGDRTDQQHQRGGAGLEL